MELTNRVTGIRALHYHAQGHGGGSCTYGCANDPSVRPQTELVAVWRSNSLLAIVKTNKATVSPARDERDIDFDRLPAMNSHGRLAARPSGYTSPNPKRHRQKPSSLKPVWGIKRLSNGNTKLMKHTNHMIIFGIRDTVSATMPLWHDSGVP